MVLVVALGVTWWGWWAISALQRVTTEAVQKGKPDTFLAGVPVFIIKFPRWVPEAEVVVSRHDGFVLTYGSIYQEVAYVFNRRVWSNPIMRRLYTVHILGHSERAKRGGRFEGLRQALYDQVDMPRIAFITAYETFRRFGIRAIYTRESKLWAEADK
jgi:hypothetical protein